MKTNKVIKIITIILLIAIITIASIFGVYKLKDYKVRNIIPEYILGMEFTESRVIDLAVDRAAKTIIYDKDGNEITEKEEGIEYTSENGYTTVENKANSDDVLTSENYKKTKSILKNRLKKFGVDQYRVNLDKSNGNLQIKIPENENTDTVIYNLLQSGTFELKDSATEEILIDTSKVKSVAVVYGQTETETSVYLQIKLNKEGRQKLEEISKTYIQTITEKANSEGEIEETTETKNVRLYLNGQSVTETYFGEPITDGILNISVGTGTNSETLEQYIQIANESAVILNSGILPITYIQTDYIETANITDKQKDIAVYSTIAILAIMTVVFIVILKTKGILATVLQIGYIALLLLTLRYTNVKITIEGIFGILLATILNYIYICKGFKNIDVNFVKETTKKYALKLIPIYVIAILLSFNSIANIYSVGMTLVWGIIIMYLYNLTLTKIVIDTIKE
ncbi:MAG: hypothetical protein IJB90_01755 [Clostridia bacterium]|nr:hypothetical protein [Clostridia bacterium]